MTDKVEGTLVLDGLLQGPLGEAPDAAAQVRRWCEDVFPLPVSLEIEGSSFSILPEGRPALTGPLGADPERTLVEKLNKLLDIVPDDRPGHLVSTLHSARYARNQEVQTIYALGADGRFELRQRRVDVQTVVPARPPTRKERVRLGLIVLVAAVAVFLVSAVFVDYRSMFRNAKQRLWPFDTEGLDVQTGPFEPYVQVSKRAASGNKLVLTLQRTDKFPTSDKALQALAKEANDSLASRLVVEALARGYLRCERFDSNGKFLGFSLHRIADLRTKKEIPLVLPLPSDRNMKRIVLAY